MAGYSGTPLPQKLGIKPGHRVALVRAPAVFDGLLESLPPDAVARRGLAGRAAFDDVTEDVVRDVALPTGLVDNKVCAIDETWSGLRLVIRLEHRR